MRKAVCTRAAAQKLVGTHALRCARTVAVDPQDAIAFEGIHQEKLGSNALRSPSKRLRCRAVNPFAWARAEILHTAWKRGLYQPPDRRVLEHDILQELARDA